MSRSSRTICGCVRTRGFSSGLVCGQGALSGNRDGARGRATDPNESDALELMVGGGIAVHARSQCTILELAGTRRCFDTSSRRRRPACFPVSLWLPLRSNERKGARCTRLSALLLPSRCSDRPVLLRSDAARTNTIKHKRQAAGSRKSWSAARLRSGSSLSC